MKSRRFVIVLDTESHQMLKAYSELTGMPITTVASQALADWLETIGAARLEALAAMVETDNLIQMPKARSATAGQA